MPPRPSLADVVLLLAREPPPAIAIGILCAAAGVHRPRAAEGRLASFQAAWNDRAHVSLPIDLDWRRVTPARVGSWVVPGARRPPMHDDCCALEVDAPFHPSSRFSRWRGVALNVSRRAPSKNRSGTLRPSKPAKAAQAQPRIASPHRTRDRHDEEADACSEFHPRGRVVKGCSNRRDDQLARSHQFQLSGSRSRSTTENTSDAASCVSSA